MHYFLLYILLFCILLFTIYKSFKKKSSIGVLISLILLVFCFYGYQNNSIQKLFITNDVILTELKYLNMTIKDDFKIVKTDYEADNIRVTTLKISTADAIRLRNEIRNSEGVVSNFDITPTKLDIKRHHKAFNFKMADLNGRFKVVVINNLLTGFKILVYNDDTIDFIKIEQKYIR